MDTIEMEEDKAIFWNNHAGYVTEALNPSVFKNWLDNASVGERTVYMTNVSPKDFSRSYAFLHTRQLAFDAYRRGEVALFQRRVHANYPGFDYIAVRISRRAYEFIRQIQQEPLSKIRERLGL